jgi:hypothetical protein
MTSRTGADAGAAHVSTPVRPVSLATWLLWGGLSGFLAGIVFIALTSWFTTSVGNPALMPFRVIATIVVGPPPTMAAIWLGMLVHSVLATLFGLVFAALTAPLRGTQPTGVLMWAGLLYGGVVYAVNFQVLARFIEYWGAFLNVNQPFEVTVHLVYGALTAALLTLLPARMRR